MSERIELMPLGTVEVEFDDHTYILRRPKMGQWRYFQRKLQEMSRTVQSGLNERTQKVTDAKTDKAREKAEADLEDYAATPFHTYTIEWLREVFNQLSDPLPESDDDWPAWLAADTQLPAKIIAHWKTSPLVSGSNGP